MAWDLGFTKVWLEIDFIEGLELIKHGYIPTHPINTLVEAITDLLSRSWQVRFSHIHRDNNRIADYLTFMGQKSQRSLSLVVASPSKYPPCYVEELQKALSRFLLTLLV